MDPVLDELIAWGERQHDVRAMILTSTRATGAAIDRFSDHDVILLCTDVAARRRDESWLRDFGEVVIAYWDDLYPHEESGQLVSGNVVYFPGTRKIDFTLWPVELAAWHAQLDALPQELDAGYRVLLDKDDLTSSWPAATGVGYRRALPTHAEYLTLVNDFLVGVPYVETALQRRELLPAKWVLDYDMRYVYLLPMLEWYAVSLHGDQVRIAANGKGVQKYLPADIWDRFATTYADLDIASNRAALWQMVALFRDVAEHVGNAIDCPYPTSLHDRVVAHARALAE